MNSVLVIAPHPDDETLGCGGTMLKHKDKGDSTHWLIVTAIPEGIGYSHEIIHERSIEIQKVGNAYGFSSVHQCGFPTTRLDTIPMSDFVKKFGEIFQEIKPNIIYLPYRGDVHTDHHIVFDAASACLKWFRYPSVKRILAYETLSDTDSTINPDINAFRPNVFIDIASFLENKIDIMKMYGSELGVFPFPRSEEAIRSLAALRGTNAGFKAAEAFMLLKERIE